MADTPTHRSSSPAAGNSDDVAGAAIGEVDPRRSPTRIPTHRYTNPAWADLEARHVWPCAWLLAATIDHVPGPGDFVEFEVGRCSVLIVRGDDGELRAFQNVCLHRGNVLCTGSGTGLTELRCPYHRWAWDLRGRLREVPSRKGFGVLRNDDAPLLPVRLDTWGPLIFVNLDVDAEPLSEYLGDVPERVAWAGIDDYACRYDLTVPLPCNWKTLIEGFSETYHVQGIHPEMLPSVDDVNSVNWLSGRHGGLYQPYGIASPRLRAGATVDEMWQSIMVTQGGRYGVDSTDPGPAPTLPEGTTMRDHLEDLLRARARDLGWGIEHFDQAQLLDLHQLNLFPNITVIVICDTVTVVRARPGATPDEAFMDVIALSRLATGEERPGPPLRATVPPEDARIGLVLDQDIANLQRAQRGLHQPGLDHLLLSREEMRIINLHRNLEEFIGMESELSTEALAELEVLRNAAAPTTALR